MTDELPEQVFKLGQRVEFLDDEDHRIEGIIHQAQLMAAGWIAYGCVADSGYSSGLLKAGEEVREISAVKQLGDLAP